MDHSQAGRLIYVLEKMNEKLGEIAVNTRTLDDAITQHSLDVTTELEKLSGTIDSLDENFYGKDDVGNTVTTFKALQGLSIHLLRLENMLGKTTV